MCIVVFCFAAASCSANGVESVGSVNSALTTNTVYDNGAVGSGWYDNSWTTHTLNSTKTKYGTKNTLSVTFGAWSALAFALSNNPSLAAGSFDTVSFYIYGGSNVNPSLSSQLYLSGTTWGPTVAINSYCDNGKIASNAWTHCAVPIAALGGNTATFSEVTIAEHVGKNLTVMAISTIQLQLGGNVDSGPDTSVADTSLPDRSVADTSVADTSVPDTSVTDTSVPDTSVPDTSVADTSLPDTSVADTSVADTSVADTSVVDSGNPNPIGSMPHLTGRTAFASEGVPSLLTDGAYRWPNAWTFTPANCTVSTPCWGAVNVGSGPSTLMVDWSYVDGEGGFNSSAWNGATVKSYSLLVSSNSTNGVDGTWSTALDTTSTPVVVGSNTLIHRTHVIQFTGFSWVKIAITSSTANELDEIDLWDASTTTSDSYLFHGDSITQRCANLRGTNVNYGEQPAFAIDIQTAHPTHFPLQVGAGIVGHSTNDAVTEVANYLPLFPMVSHWINTMGTNDLCYSSVATFTANVQSWVTSVKNAGGIPVLVHPIWGNNQVSYCYTNGPAFNAAIDSLVVSNNLTPAVPIYEATVGHPEYFDANDVHPNAAGCAVWNQTFATYANRYY